jgi:Putative transposase, YhgA-like
MKASRRKSRRIEISWYLRDVDGPQTAGPVLAIDHDRLFKELLTTFFVEFLDLFVPKVAGLLDRDSVEFLSQELYTDVIDGDQFLADIVVKVRFEGEESFFVIHVEHQSTTPQTFARRFYRYHLALSNKLGLPVYPIVVYSHDKPLRKQPNVYRVSFPDGEVLRFTYRVIQLNRLSWRRFLKLRNPAASALMAKMKVAPRDRPRVKVECLRLMVTLRLDPPRMRLIGAFVDAYLNLNEAESQRFQRLAESKLPRKQKEQIVEYVTSWERKGIEQGRQEGREQGALEALREVLRDILSTRFGATAESVMTRVGVIDSIDELRTLAHRALTAKSLAELGL